MAEEEEERENYFHKKFYIGVVNRLIFAYI